VNSAERAARAIAKRLRDAGYTAYLAGGCVRDRLLGRVPKDYDIATDAAPAAVQGLFERTIPVGAQFGVVLVIFDEQSIEVATFRSDAAYVDGRHPIAVHFSSPGEDAQRRDFTINAMFLDPETDRVIDYVGGRADLEAGVIRAVGEARERFAEDRLRMLRALRFAALLDFEIEGQTWTAIRSAAAGIIDIAWERIGDEILRMLCDSSAGTARRAFELLDASGLLVHVLPEVEALKGVEQSPDYHPEGDVFEHTLRLLQQLDQPSETLALGALLHDIAKPACFQRRAHRITFYGHTEIGADMAVQICQRLRRSRQTWERVAYLVREHLRPTNAREMRISTLKRFLASDGIEELLELARLDAQASNGDLRHYEFCREKLLEFSAAGIQPPPLLSGRDLIALGLDPGPRFKRILDAIGDAQLEGTLQDRAQAIAWVRAHFREAQAREDT